MEPRIGRRALSQLCHRRRGIDPGKLSRVGTATGDQAQLVADTTAHIKDPAWAGMARKGNCLDALTISRCS